MQIDHINGDGDDHTPNNIRFLCPNCHSQTETWGQVKNADYHENEISSKFGGKCCECGKELLVGTKTNMCQIHYRMSTRKVERPDNDILQKEIVELGYRGTGKKYGVSDNCIRKWIKLYNKNW